MFGLTINFLETNIKMIKTTFNIKFVILICFQPFKSHNIMITTKIKECYILRLKKKKEVILLT